MAAGGDSNTVLNLFPCEVKGASGYQRRNECRESGVVPAAFANARESGLAEPHFEFVSQDNTHYEFVATRACAFAAGNRGGKNVGWMRRILLPINIVVIHAADHQRIRERRGNRINALTCPNDRRRTGRGGLIEHFESDLHVMLLKAAQCTAEGVEQESLGLVNGIGRELLVLQLGCPARHLLGDCFARRNGLGRGQEMLLIWFVCSSDS